jgi:hypothetical protein
MAKDYRDMNLDKLKGTITKEKKAELGIAKELNETYQSIGKELKEQLKTQDSIDKAINSMFGFENQMVGLQEKKKALGKNASQEEQKKLETQIQSVQASRDMAASLSNSLGPLKSMVNGAKSFQLAFMANPIFAIAAVLIAVAKLMMKFASAAMDTRKELGLSFKESVKLTAQTEALGFAAKAYGLDVSNIKAAQTAIRGELGLSVQEAANLSLQFAKTAAFTGQTEGQLANTLSIMESISDASREALLAQIETTGQMIEQAGLAPGDIFKDLADNAEAFAGFAKDGGMNVIKTAMAAKKLGLNMSAVSSITEGLLDFESSIEKQMEASVLLGRQLNLDRARQLALTGDQVGMMKEVLKQVGGEAEFNKMNVLQRRALAESVGTNVEQLSRLVRNQTATNTGRTVAGKKDNTEKVLSSQLDFIESSNGYLRTISKEI